MSKGTVAHYMTGITALDEEHVNVFNYIDEMLKACGDGAKVLKLFDEFILFLVAHFKMEELYMTEIGFPYIVPHTEMHLKIISRLRNSSRRSHADINYVDSKYYLNDLTRMLLTHIDHYDLQIGEYKKEKDRKK